MSTCPGYLIEKSLSIDNVFVWAVIFAYFGVPDRYQFRVLFWGIFGALVLRAVFIFAGVALLERFDWVLYVFGAFLLVTAVKIARHAGPAVDPERNVVLRARPARRAVDRRVRRPEAVHPAQRRVARDAAVRRARADRDDRRRVRRRLDPRDPRACRTSRSSCSPSNAFAILGLRSLYFCLAGMADRFRYLELGLGVILAFVGVKMLLADVVHSPRAVSLAVIVGVLAVTVVASRRAERRRPPDPDPIPPAHRPGGHRQSSRP